MFICIFSLDDAKVTIFVVTRLHAGNNHGSPKIQANNRFFNRRIFPTHPSFAKSLYIFCLCLRNIPICPMSNESPLFDPGFEACNNHSHHEATAASSGIALAAGNRTLRGQLAGCRCGVVAEGRG